MTDTASASNDASRVRMVGLALVLVTLVLYLPVTWHGFINYDDPDYITQNPMVQRGLSLEGIRWAFTGYHASNWHPLTWISHMLDCQLFGLDPGPHHLVGVLLHIVNAVLLLTLLYRLTGRLWGAAIVAALFAWHPLHVQSVAWAAERKDVLSTAFWLASLLAYYAFARRATGEAHGPARSHRWKWYFLALACCAFGLMSKPMVVTLPFTLLLLDFWPLRRIRIPGAPLSVRTSGAQPAWALIIEKWPFFLLSLAAALLTFQAQRTEAVITLERHPLMDRISNAVCSYGAYLWKTVWPVDLSVIYPLPRSVAWGCLALSAVCLAAISFYAWHQRTSRPHLLWGWLWYLGTLLPVIGLVQVGGQAMADRYTYVPLIGIFCAAVWEVCYWIDRKPQIRLYARVSGGLILGLCLLLNTLELRNWKSSETLFQHALAVTRDNAVAHSNLGAAYEESDRRAEAMAEYREALRLNPGLSQAHNNLASLLEKSNELDEALVHYREAVRLKPNAWQARANLAACLALLGRTDEAAQSYDIAVRLLPGDPRPAYALAKAFLSANRTEFAIQKFREALRVDPNHVPSLVYLARLLASSPEPQFRNGPEATQLAERAITLSGEDQPFLLDTLGMAYAEVGRFPDAVRVVSRAIELSRAAGDAGAVAAMEERLSLYQSQKPYREVLVTPAPLAP